MFNDFDPRKNLEHSAEKRTAPSVGILLIFIIGFFGGFALFLMGLFFLGIELFARIFVPSMAETFSLNDFLAFASSDQLARHGVPLTSFHEWLGTIPATPVLIVVGAALIGIAVYVARTRT